MDIPEPQNARGKVLLNIIKGGNQIYELQILDISDYHGQLTPLTETADNVSSAGAANPVVPDRRLGVPEAVVRRLPRRGARRDRDADRR